jgi:hypothetical protein
MRNLPRPLAPEFGTDLPDVDWLVIGLLPRLHPLGRLLLTGHSRHL